MGGKVYAVRVGHRPGIYDSWEEVKPLVMGFPGAQHKSFKSRLEAERYLEAANLQTVGSKRTRDYNDDNNGDDGNEAERCQSRRRSSAGPVNCNRDNSQHRAPSPARAPVPAPVYATLGVLIAGPPRASSASGYDPAVVRSGLNGSAVNGSSRPGGNGCRFDAVVEGPLQPIRASTDYDLEFDGAARGNPGQAGCGAVLRRSDTKTVVCRLRKYMGGRSTNNEAEYTALIEGLRMARRLGATRISALGDSKLVVMQVAGTWKINKDHLRELCGQVLQETRQLDRFSIRHIPREYNGDADKLSNDAIDLVFR